MPRNADPVVAPERERESTRERPPRDGFRPAYGPVDAALGLALFYVVIERVTPTVVDVATTALPSVSASTVTTVLAGVIWFVVVVTLLDQVRKQIRALAGDDSDTSLWTRVPSETETSVASLAVVVGGTLAYYTFEVAMATLPSLVRAVATVNVEALVAVDFVALVTFFLGYAAATWGADRLLVGGVRTLATE